MYKISKRKAPLFSLVKNMDIIQTQMGGKKLLHEGYEYHLNKEVGDKIYWKCVKRKFCKGRAITQNGSLIISNQHSHSPNIDDCETKKLMQAIRTKSCQSEAPSSAIVKECMSQVPIEIARKLPKQESLSRSVRRYRKKNLIYEDLTLTTRGEEFLLFQNDEVQIYSTANNIDFLKRNKRWFGDGTFDSVPIGYQLYTIHALVDKNKAIPLVYCFTKNRNEKSYFTIFNFLSLKGLQPLSITIDFERFAINQIKNLFPETKIYGCFDHFGQCLWINIQRFGLTSWCQENSNAMIIKQLQALAFVPPDEVNDIFDRFINQMDEKIDEILGEFLQYFETTWLGIVQRGKRRKPLIEIDIWNVCDRLANDLPRTNNSVEGWHNLFNHRLQICHPNIDKLLREIRIEQASTEVIIRQIQNGVAVEKTHINYEDINQRLKRIFINYKNMDALDYINSIAQNF
uniref:FLYWCH-type domain-containing protein n=1 Tax=Lepeophtheirus salmonis TaxID=72036 RepID=A0A0K2SY70_LEPSM